LNRIQLMRFHRLFCDNGHRLMGRKNADYATGGDVREDAFKNFRKSEEVTSIPVEVGILIRLSDKIARLGRLLQEGYKPQVDDEKVEDTLLDIVNYAVLIAAFLSEKGVAVVNAPANGNGTSDDPTDILLPKDRFCRACD